MSIARVGARMVFYFAATHGAGPAIAAFSVAHHITGPGAWTAALVMMALADVLTRLAVVYLRGRRLTPSTPVLAAPAQAGVLFMPPHGPVRLGRTEAEAMGLPASRQPTSGLVPASTSNWQRQAAHRPSLRCPAIVVQPGGRSDHHCKRVGQ